MVKLQERESEIVKKVEALKDAIDVIQQPRTNFEIAHYMVGQHATPGRQWVQCVLQLQISMFNIRRAQLNVQIIQAEIKDLRSDPQTEICEIKAQLKEVDLQELELARLGAVREAETLYAIFKQLPTYTREKFEAEEPEFWRIRLSEQMMLDGNRAAARQALTPVGEKRSQLLTEEQIANLAMLGEVEEKLLKEQASRP